MADEDLAGQDVQTRPRKVSSGAGLKLVITICVFIAIFVVFAFVTVFRNARVSTVAAVQPSPTGKAAVGGQGNPQYNAMVNQQNAQQADTAESQHQSSVATVSGPTPPPQQAIFTPSAPAPVPSALPPRPASETPQAVLISNQQQQQQSRAEEETRLAQAMVTEFGTIDKETAPTAPNVLELPSNASVNGPASAAALSQTIPGTQRALNQEPLTAAAATPPSAPTNVKPGEILYAVNELTVNSDIGGPVIATILTPGVLNDAKLIGGFQMQDDKLVIRFDTVTLKTGETLDVEGFAVSPSTKETAVADQVDNHYFYRWAGFLAGSFLAGYGQAIQQSGTSTSSNVIGGGTSTVTQNPTLTTKQELIVAAGAVGGKVGSVLQNNVSRPTTVILNAGTPIGVAIVKAPQAAVPAATTKPNVPAVALSPAPAGSQ